MYDALDNPNLLVEYMGKNCQKIKDYISLGLNRLSIGGQSFCDKQLIKLNRNHNSNDVINSIRTAQEGGIENINLDLMYGLPGLSNKDWIKLSRSDNRFYRTIITK